MDFTHSNVRQFKPRPSRRPVFTEVEARYTQSGGQTHSINGYTSTAESVPHVVAACSGCRHCRLVGPPSQLRVPASKSPDPGIQSQDGPDAPSGCRLVMVAVGKGGLAVGTLVRVITLAAPVLQYDGDLGSEVAAVAQIRSLYSGMKLGGRPSSPSIVIVLV